MRYSTRNVFRWRLRKKLILATVIFIVFYVITASRLNSSLSRTSWPLFNLKLSQPGRLRLHLVLPASSSDINVCRALLSASILGYPPPTLIDWSSPPSPSHLGKLNATLLHLSTMPSSQNADLVLMTDSLDTWFQLPPSLLMKRYHSINQRANARSLARYGSLNRRTLAQTIVFGSEKKCWPNPPSSLACYSVPDSPLSHSLFGPRTDEVRDEEDDENPYQYVRPRWLNSGFIMGPVRDIKRVFVRAVEMAERLERDGEGKEGEVEGVVMKGEVGMTDQGVLSRVWGEQEFSREEKLVEDVAAVKDKANGKADWGDLGKWRLQMGVNYEFGIGIDYARELSATTQWSWYDAEWITICDNDTTLDAADRFEVEMPRVSGLQEDVAASALPFAALEKRLKVDGMTWQNVSLYTSLWTGIVPVSIHHNAKKDGQKRVRDKEWRRMWFAPYAKQFLDERVRAVEGKGKVFGVETMGKKGERGWISWNELCDQGMQKILFEL